MRCASTYNNITIVSGNKCTQWISSAIDRIKTFYAFPDVQIRVRPIREPFFNGLNFNHIGYSGNFWSNFWVIFRKGVKGFLGSKTSPMSSLIPVIKCTCGGHGHLHISKHMRKVNGIFLLISLKKWALIV